MTDLPPPSTSPRDTRQPAFLPPPGARVHPPGNEYVHPAFALPEAPWGRRGAALFLDLLVQVLLIVTVGAIAAAVTGGDSFSYEVFESEGGTSTDTFPYWAAWGAGAAAVTLLTYPWLALGLTGGRSPGRRAVGIRVVGYDGRSIGLGTAFLREGVTKAMFGLFGLPLVLSFLWPLWDPHQRALHDLVCTTRAVRYPGVTDAFGGDPSRPADTTRSATQRRAADGDDLADRIGLGG